MKTLCDFACAVGLAGCILLVTAQHLYAGAPETTEIASDLAVVVNGTNPVDELSMAELRRILLGDRRFWRGNVQVKLVLPRVGSRERDKLLTTLVGMSSLEFARYWKDKVFRGEAPDEPPSLSIDGSSRYVSENPGALAFVAHKNIRADVKILRVDGKLPGAPGYVLKCPACQHL